MTVAAESSGAWPRLSHTTSNTAHAKSASQTGQRRGRALVFSSSGPFMQAGRLRQGTGKFYLSWGETQLQQCLGALTAQLGSVLAHAAQLVDHVHVSFGRRLDDVGAGA